MFKQLKMVFAFLVMVPFKIQKENGEASNSLAWIDEPSLHPS